MIRKIENLKEVKGADSPVKGGGESSGEGEDVETKTVAFHYLKSVNDSPDNFKVQANKEWVANEV